MTNSVLNSDENTFFHFLQDYVEQWNYANIHEKDRELHEFLNVECGAGVFTNQVDSISIRIHYDDTHEIIINTTNDLAIIDEQLERFLLTL